MFKRINGNYKVVEINNVAALRTGAIIAQAPLYNNENSTKWKDKTVVENGYILFLDKDGILRAPADASVKTVPVLHYTEELFTDRYTTLNTFAVEFIDNVAYPRGLVLTVGDSFTTDNAVIEDEDAVYTLADDGSFVKWTSGDNFLFAGKNTTLPDGETAAVELTYIGFGGAQ